MGGNETFSANTQNIKKFQLSQKARSLLVIGIIVVPVVIGYFAYGAYKLATQDPDSVASNASTSAANQSPASSASGTSTPAGQAATSNTPSVPSPQPSTSPTPTSSPTATQQTQSSTLPQGVTVAMNSIEKNGIKGNSYISSNLDTSQIPSGTTVKFDRPTWTMYSKDIGAVNATINALGEAHTASVTFGVENGTWKVAGYSISQ